jgi:hypothetical protein
MTRDPGKKDAGKKGPVPAWRVGVKGVEGVTPPGRRLDQGGERRPTAWSASGVKGVTPPGKLGPAEGPAAAWALRKDGGRASAEKANRRLLEQRRQATARSSPRPDAREAAGEHDPMRPVAGFLPDPFGDVGDPTDVRGFLQSLGDFLAAHPPGEGALEDLAGAVLQGRAPYDVAVAFTLLNALVGKSEGLRRKHGPVLERGAKVFFNLASRLKADVKVPRGLVPETTDALFYDLPATGYQLPYAFATLALLRLLERLRRPDDPDHDRALGRFARDLYERFVGARALGDRPLSLMFPWEPPGWLLAAERGV